MTQVLSLVQSAALAVLTLADMICIASGAWFAYALPRLRALLRPIYVKRGIMAAPTVDTGAKTL